MTRAAAVLHTVQSNVTARIKRLEDEIGATLIVRGSRKLRLTAEGEALMPFALRLEELSAISTGTFVATKNPGLARFESARIETFAASRLVGAYCAVHGAPPFDDISVQTRRNRIVMEQGWF